MTKGCFEFLTSFVQWVFGVRNHLIVKWILVDLLSHEETQTVRTSREELIKLAAVTGEHREGASARNIVRHVFSVRRSVDVRAQSNVQV